MIGEGFGGPELEVEDDSIFALDRPRSYAAARARRTFGFASPGAAVRFGSPVGSRPALARVPVRGAVI